MEPGPRQIILSPSHSMHSHPSLNSQMNHSTVPSLSLFPSVPTIPQSISETWHNHNIPTSTQNFAPQNMFHYRPLPVAPVQSSNTFMNDTTTPLGSPVFSPLHYIQSPVSVPPASVRLPSRLCSRMTVHPNINRTPSRIMHQPCPHRIVDLDHLYASAHLLPEIQSALAIMSEFHCKHYPMLPRQSEVPHSPTQWVAVPPRAPVKSMPRASIPPLGIPKICSLL
ncbi:hypothetical protein F5877DRAFT_85979 [Lentinula edodes]|nr:hypothetical protein F5877DRAFT_85979 [Lentinula edodes]